jgi:hypothetical protein
MKALFFLLSLANVVLFMWEFHNGAFVVKQTSTDKFSEDLESIWLVGEAGNSSVPDQVEMTPKLPKSNLTSNDEISEKTENEQLRLKKEINIDLVDRGLPVHSEIRNESSTVFPEKVSDICFELGPFPNEQTYKLWESQIKGDIKRINKEEKIIKDYLVYYPASATLPESEANLKMLKAKGVKELWLMRQGPEVGQISLGIFDKEDKALSLKKQMETEGIITEINPRYQIKIQLFAVLKGQTNRDEILSLLKKSYPDVKVKSLAADSQECL